VDIAFVLYDNLTALDLVGPYETLAWHPSATPHFVAEETGPVHSDNGLIMHATTTFGDLPSPDVIVVPGSSRFVEALADTVLLDWLSAAHETATWTASVCTGSTLLAKAGILTGRPATTHWGARELLGSLGAVVSHERVVIDGSVITGAGVSAGIDLGLTLSAEIWGEETARAVQLMLEYDPRPPFDSGSPEKADPELLAKVGALLSGQPTQAG
jgi:transcriptional regulator GlxA family with amidase domain